MSTTVDSAASASASKYLSNYDWTPGSSRTVSKTLTQEDFLSLVAAEMSNQDPLNPTSNTEYIAQMAQFSTLEQSKSMQQDISALQASNLIGRNVTVEEAVEGEEPKIFQGPVTSVLLEKGVPSVEVNGVFYPMESLIAIEPVTTPATPNS